MRDTICDYNSHVQIGDEWYCVCMRWSHFSRKCLCECLCDPETARISKSKLKMTIARSYEVRHCDLRTNQMNLFCINEISATNTARRTRPIAIGGRAGVWRANSCFSHVQLKFRFCQLFRSRTKTILNERRRSRRCRRRHPNRNCFQCLASASKRAMECFALRMLTLAHTHTLICIDIIAKPGRPARPNTTKYD